MCHENKQLGQRALQRVARAVEHVAPRRAVAPAAHGLAGEFGQRVGRGEAREERYGRQDLRSDAAGRLTRAHMQARRVGDYG